MTPEEKEILKRYFAEWRKSQSKANKAARREAKDYATLHAYARRHGVSIYGTKV